jgi:hypothetical protein
MQALEAGIMNRILMILTVHPSILSSDKIDFTHTN